MRRITRMLWIGISALLLSITTGFAEEEKIPVDKLPKAVMDAVKAKFPGADLKGAEKEEEDGKTIYEVALVHKGATYDVSATADGKIIEIEKLITAKDLPAAVIKAVEAKYPKATVKKAEEITKGDKTLFEVVIETADKKKVEVVLEKDGKIVEEEVKTGDKDE